MKTSRINKEAGAFVISLDFEIMWGVRDKPDIRSYYYDNLIGVRKVIPTLLRTFSDFDVSATFATVGMLFAKDKNELIAFLPSVYPKYQNTQLSPYAPEYIAQVGANEEEDPLHFADSLVQLIKSTPGQEIGCHTFSHYYCLEAGPTLEAFRADITAAIAIANTKGIALKSLVFPRNQFNKEYLKVLEENGFIAYRGNENSWLYRARNREAESYTRRLGRLLDTYLNVSGSNIYTWQAIQESGTPFNIPASRFLRPYNPKLKMLESFRQRRILNDMTQAAKTGSIFHLWWHPHNFGVHLTENVTFLTRLLSHFQQLKKQYGFQSLTMEQVAFKVQALKNGE